MLKIHPVQWHRAFLPGLARSAWQRTATVLLFGLEKVHCLLLPDLVQRFQRVVPRFGGDLRAQLGDRLLRLGTGNLQQRPETTGVGTFTLVQTRREQGQQVRDVRQALAGLEVFAGGQELQYSGI